MYLFRGCRMKHGFFGLVFLVFAGAALCWNLVEELGPFWEEVGNHVLKCIVLQARSFVCTCLVVFEYALIFQAWLLFDEDILMFNQPQDGFFSSGCTILQ